ncbi:MAG: FkbM family methyltransferase [Planctomycetaceae bacterium]|nr:FkbM family methyltransferase [Planctomycetaceae bacterium]
MTFNEKLEYVFQNFGIDLRERCQINEDFIEIDGITIPRFTQSAAQSEMNHSLFDIVLSSVLRREWDCSDKVYEVIESFFSEGPYEYGEVSIDKGDVVFDCGANIGLFSAVASRYGAHVYAFEAIPNTIDDFLSKTAAVNGNIMIYNNAVWDEEKILDFSVIENHIGASRCDKLLWNGADVRERYKVQAITLDAFVERLPLERVDFIKSDIEGAERNLLRGAKNVLKRFSPKLSICSYHLPDDPQVLRALILDANPNYVITKKYSKIYAYVPCKWKHTV